MVKLKCYESYNQSNLSFSVTHQSLVFCQSQTFQKVNLFPKQAESINNFSADFVVNTSKGQSCFLIFVFLKARQEEVPLHSKTRAEHFLQLLLPQEWFTTVCVEKSWEMVNVQPLPPANRPNPETRIAPHWDTNELRAHLPTSWTRVWWSCRHRARAPLLHLRLQRTLSLAQVQPCIYLIKRREKFNSTVFAYAVYNVMHLIASLCCD